MSYISDLPTVYEWVMVPFNEGEEFYLTEKQYEVYKEHQDDAKLFFADFSFAPSGIFRSYKRPAQKIKEMYPCKTCNGNGYKPKNSVEIDICQSCGGTGIMPL